MFSFLCSLLMVLSDASATAPSDCQARIRQLGSPEWSQREEASGYLRTHLSSCGPALRWAYTRETDPEIRWRLSDLLEEKENQDLATLGKPPEIDALWYCPRRHTYLNNPDLVQGPVDEVRYQIYLKLQGYVDSATGAPDAFVPKGLWNDPYRSWRVASCYFYQDLYRQGVPLPLIRMLRDYMEVQDQIWLRRTRGDQQDE